MHWVRLVRLNSYKQSLRFESENLHFWSPVDSPFETCFRSEGKIHICNSGEIEPPFESNNETNQTRNEDINITCAQCTAIILFD